MDPLTYAVLTLVISDLETNKISLSKPIKMKYYGERDKQKVKNPRLKLGHPIIQPMGEKSLNKFLQIPFFIFFHQTFFILCCFGIIKMYHIRI